MIKSALRLIKFPRSTDNALTEGTAAYARLVAITSRNVCTTSPCNKEIRISNEKVRVSRGSKYDTLMEGENTIGLARIDQEDPFPDIDTPNKLFNGVPFKQLHIVNIKSTPNNTIMTLTDYKGKGLSLHSSGIEGFKNAKKGTNIAAQQAAVTFGNRIREFGINTIRIRIQGIGAGRMSSVKGLHMTGLNIVSITDDTRVFWQMSQRPRKQRRV